MSVNGVNCMVTAPVAPPAARLLLAHGAGAPMDSAFMEAYTNALSLHGVEVVRFEFGYMDARRSDGRKRPPDRAAKLLDRWHQVVEGFSESGLTTFLGGKSMGGRMASLYAAERGHVNMTGVVCLGYPFHPVGQPDRLRIAHFQTLELPCLVIQGERDRFGSQREVLDYALGQAVTVRWLPTCDHDFKPLKSSGLTQAEMIHSAAAYSAQFMGRLGLCPRNSDPLMNYSG